MRSYRRTFTVHLVLSLSILFISAACAQDIITEYNVPMKTRDSVTLRADIYRPKGDAKYPVLVERTPYDKRMELSFGPKVASAGYVFVVQDVRGRWASDGEWYPMVHEASDGYDCIEWAAALPYSNGKVGMWGGSYVGATQMQAALAAPPHLVCIMPYVTASNYHEQWVYQGGAFSQLLNQAWSTALSLNTLERRVSRDAQPSHWDMTIPLVKYPMLDVGTAEGLGNYYYDWLKHPAYDDFWKQTCVEEHLEQIKVPALHVGGWYDMFKDGTVRNYRGIKDHGGTDAARQGQRLVMVVGGHAGMGPKVGEVDFGQGSVMDIWEMGRHWYDYVLKGIDSGVSKEKPVKIFVMGTNVWRDEDDWPPARAITTHYYLHSDGNANTLHGDGTLSTKMPKKEKPDTYTYDPENPVPTTGGPAFGDSHQIPGPHDQQTVEARPDVLNFTTEAFADNVEVTGPVTLELFVSSSALDTDFTGKLVDVSPDGYAKNLDEGILRARYRNSMERAELMKPGEIYKLTINLSATSNVFLAGHKLRVEVSSSNFPRFDRNLNTGADIASPSAEHQKAVNVVYHDSDHPSALIVPMIPK